LLRCKENRKKNAAAAVYSCGQRTWYAREKGRGERTGFLERAETVIIGDD
jgi:predicted secreted protein